MTPLEHLTLTIGALCKTVFAHAGAVSRGWTSPACAVAAHPWMVLPAMLHNRLQRGLRRFTALFEMWKAGTLPKARPVRVRKEPSQGVEPKPRVPDLIPRGRLWLVKRVQAVAVYGSQLGMIAQTPEMARFLAEVPQARRLLRPVIAMTYDVMPEVLRLPKRVRKPRPKKVLPELKLGPAGIAGGATIDADGWMDWPAVSPWGTPRSIIVPRLGKKRRFRGA